MWKTHTFQENGKNWHILVIPFKSRALPVGMLQTHKDQAKQLIINTLIKLTPYVLNSTGLPFTNFSLHPHPSWLKTLINQTGWFSTKCEKLSATAGLDCEPQLTCIMHCRAFMNVSRLPHPAVSWNTVSGVWPDWDYNRVDEDHNTNRVDTYSVSEKS